MKIKRVPSKNSMKLFIIIFGVEKSFLTVKSKNSIKKEQAIFVPVSKLVIRSRLAILREYTKIPIITKIMPIINAKGVMGIIKTKHVIPEIKGMNGYNAIL